MLSTDREEFNNQLRKLCAGFNVPVGDRETAYWTGLDKMSLLQFVRCVDYCLGEGGPDKIPTTPQMWRIHKVMRTTAAPGRTVMQIEQQDHLLHFANRMFLRHIANRGGVGSASTFKPGYGMTQCESSEELNAARVVVHQVVEWFAGPIREGDVDATPHAFVTQFIKELGKVSRIAQETLDGWTEMIQHEDALKPFAPYMGREIQFKQAAA